VKYTNTSLITDSKFAGFFLDKFPLVLGLLPSEFDNIRNFFK
jgi:membrane protein required for colicin V production